MRRLLLLVGATVFADAMFFAALTPLLAELAGRYDLSKAGAGVLAAAYPASVFLGGIPAGVAAVRLGFKPVAVASTLLVSATTVAFALVNLAWASGQAGGSAGAGALARATADAVPYLLLCGACLLTLVAMRRA